MLLILACHCTKNIDAITLSIYSPVQSCMLCNIYLVVFIFGQFFWHALSNFRGRSCMGEDLAHQLLGLWVVMNIINSIAIGAALYMYVC